MSNNWIAIASADHVSKGKQQGFMQVCHGKAGPLNRIKPGDNIVYYSPVARFGEPEKLQAFTAIGVVKYGQVYEADMGSDKLTHRRDVDWFDAEPVPIRPLLDVLDFSAGKQNWGYQLRFGLFAVSDHDIAVIAAAMDG